MLSVDRHIRRRSLQGPPAGAIDETGEALWTVTFVGALGAKALSPITIHSDTTEPLTDSAGATSDVSVLSWVTVPGAAQCAYDEVQQVEATGATGTFTLSLAGATAAVAVGASDAQLEADLASLPLIGSTANVSVSGSGTAADPYEATFIGALAGESVPQLTVLGSAVENAIHTTFNADGSIASIGDNYSDYSYTYDGQGNAASVDNSGSPNMPHVVLTSAFDAAGNRASLAATISGRADFVNSYGYDDLSRLIDLTQQGVTGGNSVATKQVYYTLDPLGNATGIYRSANTTPGEQTTGPAYSTLTYNTHGLLSAIDQLHDGTQLEDMIFTYDALDRVSTFQSNDGTATYGYDSVNEVTSANYTTASGGHQPANETYGFDLNGNRSTLDGVTTGISVNNEVTNDSTFTYTFDADGNRLTRTRDDLSSPHHDDLVSYTWDSRNRLTGVEEFSWNAASSSWVETEAITYTYDVFDHLIERVDDVIGSGTTTTQYVWDLLSPLPPGEGQGEGGVILAFTNGTLTSRYLNGPNTSAYDQYFSTLAEENAGTGATTWDLLGPKGSVRDVIDNNGNLIDHIVYNSNGQTDYESNSSVSHLLGWQGGFVDTATGQENFGKRWYDPAAAVWDSEDPLGFGGGSTNLTESRANDATNFTDPTGEFLPLLIIGGVAGADIYIWWKNAVVIDAMLNNRPINPADTPYSLQYHKGLTCSTALGGGGAVVTPVVASIFPAQLVTVVVVSGSAYGLYSNGAQALTDFEAGNHAQGVFHLGMSASAGYGGYQVTRSALGWNEVPQRSLLSEYFRFRRQGHAPRQARYLLDPYPVQRMGNHSTIGRQSSIFGTRAIESPYNVMKPNGISRGRFYERHALGDEMWRGCRFPGSVGGVWSRTSILPNGFGLRERLNSPLYALPDRTQGAITVVIVDGSDALIGAMEVPDTNPGPITLKVE